MSRSLGDQDPRAGFAPVGPSAASCPRCGACGPVRECPDCPDPALSPCRRRVARLSQKREAKP